MRKNVFKRITALFLCLFLMFGCMPALPAKTAVATGDLPLYIPGGEYEAALNVYFGGAIADFSLGDGRLIDVSGSFTGTVDIPVSLFDGRGQLTPYIYLLPYGNSSPEGFVSAYKETYRDYSRSGLYYVKAEERSVITDYERVRIEAGQLVAENNVPSGVYVPCVLFYDSDIVNNDSSVMDVTLFTAAYPVCVSNPADGGFKGDPSEYIPERNILLDVSVELDGWYGSLENVRVTVYSEDHSVCYGISPCYVPNGRVSLDIAPGSGSSAYTDEYDFPSESKGNSRIIEVPEDGNAVVTVYKYGLRAQIDGHVYSSNGTAAAGAVVSYSTEEGYSASTRADSNGYFCFDELYTNKDVKIYASKERESYSGTVKTTSLQTGRAGIDIELESRKPAFYLKLSGSSDEVLSEIMPGMIESGINVTDGKMKTVEGDLVMENGNTLAFFPYPDAKKTDLYKINPDERFISEKELSVKEGETAELTVNSFAIVKGVVTSEDNPGYPHIFFFDGNELAFGFSCATGQVYQLTEVPESGKQYRVVVILDVSREYIPLDAETIAERFPDAAEMNVVLENGKTVDLGNVETVYNRSYALGGLSYASALAKTENGENIIKVKGHIETEGKLVIKAIRAYGYTYGSSESYLKLAAGYKENSLVINKKVRPEKIWTSAQSFTDVGRVIKLDEPVEGKADFSLTLSRFFDGDVIVRVAADVTIDGTEYTNYTVDECLILGKAVTLSARSETADGFVSAGGTAVPGETVYVLDGDQIIGSTFADQTGNWNLGVNLLTVPGRRSIHKIRAKSSGIFTEDVMVVYDPDGTSVGEIYMSQNGIELPKTYTWTMYSKFAFNAVVTGDKVSDPSFVVLCSDGTTMRLDAYYNGTVDAKGATKTLYSTDEVNFGEMNICPIKAWFEITKERQPFNTESVVSINAGKKATEEELKRLDHVYDANEIEKSSIGGLTIPSGTVKSVITVAAGKSDRSEFEKLKSSGAAFVTICDDNGWDKYETCSMLDGMKYYLCVHDVSTDTYTLTVNSYDLRSADGSLAMLDTAGILPENEIRLLGTGDQEMAKSYVIDTVGGMIRDEAMDSLNPLIKNLLQRSKKTAAFANVVDHIGVSDLYTIYETAAYGVDYKRKSSDADEEMAMLKFFSRAANEIKRDADTLKLTTSVNNAMHDISTANEMQSDALGQSIALALANWALAKFGPEAEVIVGSTEWISGPMMEEVKSHSDEAWCYAMQSVTEAKREFQLLTGMSKDEMLQLYRDYAAGKITGYDIKKRIEESMKNKNSADKENSEDFEPIIDPSGYVYEAVASNRIEGATVTLLNGNGEYFDAGSYGQLNPLTSDSDGRYAWDVPEGNWFVQAYKAGYEPGDSGNDPAATVTINGKNCLPVLPPQLDVNIPLMSGLRPNASLEIRDGSLYLVFDKYMQVDTVNANTVKLVLKDGNAGSYGFEAKDSEVSPAHTPVCGGMALAKTFLVTGVSGLSDASGLKVTITNAIGYNGKQVETVLRKNYSDSDGPAPTGTDPEATKPPRKNDDDDDEEGISPIPFIIIGSVLVLAGAGTAVFFVLKKKKKQQ